MTVEELASLVEEGRPRAIAKAFARLDEKARRASAKDVLALHQRTYKDEATSRDQRATVTAAAIACASLPELKKLGWRVRFAGDELTYDLLAARRPPWLDEYAEWICERWTFDWRLVRRLVRAGLCAKPKHDGYIVGMLSSLGPRWKERGSLESALRADPALLKDEVWRIFEVEGTSRTSLANMDKYSGGKREGGWTATLLRLSGKGQLDRARLLDASLDALERDFLQFRAGWYSRFHEAMEPTLAERVKRRERYLALVGSRIPPTVSFALDALRALAEAGKLPAAAARLEPALSARHKATARGALALLARAAEDDPRALVVAAGGLAHEAAEVQRAAIELIEARGDRKDRELGAAVERRAGGVAASLRKRVAAWVGGGGASRPGVAVGGGAGEVEVAGARKRAAALPARLAKLAGVDAALRGAPTRLAFTRMDLPCLDPAGAIAPIATVDDLIDALATLLEQREDPLQTERALDGVSRLAAEQPADFAQRTAPLLKRARKLADGRWRQPFLSDSIRFAVAGLAIAWASGEAPVEPATKPSVAMFLVHRIHEVARRAAARIAAPLLAAPTHAGGWLAPGVLVGRVRASVATRQTPTLLDAVQALLRLAPDGRAAARAGAAKLDGELGAALRHALGSPAPRDKIGPTAALWAAAARARAPGDDDPLALAKHPSLGPDAGAAARWSFDVKTLVWGQGKFSRPDVVLTCVPAPSAPRQRKGEPRTSTIPIPLVATQLAGGDLGENELTEVRAVPLTWPARLDAFFAHGAVEIGNAIDWGDADHHFPGYLEPLGDPDLPLDEMALLVLAIGLSAKQRRDRGLATDLLIAAIGDGREDGSALGDTIARLVPRAQVKPARLALSLTDAAAIGPLHREVARRIIVRALHGASDGVRELNVLLELLVELSVESGVALGDDRTRGVLAKLGVGGKSAKATKQVLALEETPDAAAHRAAVAAVTLEARVARAERWAAWQAGRAG